jgi:nickel transport protein
MKRFAVCFFALLLSLCFADISLAHRVNVFAFVDGDAVRVECSFSKNHPVKQGTLKVSDHETGAFLLEGTTDAQGIFRFRPDADFLKTGHGVTILLKAGEGHQNEWQITAEELQALSPEGVKAEGGGNGVSVPETNTPQSLADGASSAMDVAELEALVGKVMDAKLAPIKQALARQENSGPDIRDIVGGIGWIIGLLGLAAYLRYRPRPSGQGK